MKKILIWLFIKSIVPHMRIVFINEDSAFEYSTDTVYLNLNENCNAFMRHLKESHLPQYTPICNKHLGLYNFNKTIWQILHEIGHYFTLDYCKNDDKAERAICALIDKDTAENSETIQDLYFNLGKEWEATECAIHYANTHYRKCSLFNKLLGG